MEYTISAETSPGVFTDIGVVYDDTNGPVEDHLVQLQSEDGRCYAATAIL